MISVTSMYTEMNMRKSNDITMADNMNLHMHKCDNVDTGKVTLHSGELSMQDCEDINGAVTHIGGFGMHEHDCDSSSVTLHDDNLHVHGIGPLSYKGETYMPSVLHKVYPQEK